MKADGEREFIHLKIPFETKERLRRLRYETRVSYTDILIRLLARADKEAVLEDWVKPAPKPMEVSSPAP